MSLSNGDSRGVDNEEEVVEQQIPEGLPAEDQTNEGAQHKSARQGPDNEIERRETEERDETEQTETKDSNQDVRILSL